MLSKLSFVFFFFQAEDGIRDADVTGVQTCALPISEGVFLLPPPGRPSRKEDGPTRRWCKSNQHPCLGRGWRIFSHRHLPSLEKPRHFREEGDLPPAGARRLSDPAGKEETPARL